MDKVIGIVGMHRSGTSCLAGSLQAAGLFLGDVYTQNPHNLKGNREHKAIQQLNDDVLVANGGSWMEPPESVNWSTDQINRRQRIIEDFAEIPVWGFKDPRTLLVIDGWLESLPDMLLVGTLRHPAAVVDSLKKRNPGLRDDHFWLALWFKYNQRLLYLHDKKAFPIINFDHSEKNYNQQLLKILRTLGLRKTFSGYLMNLEIRRAFSALKYKNDFFEKKLRHHAFDSPEKSAQLPAPVAELYRDLLSVAL